MTPPLYFSFIVTQVRKLGKSEKDFIDLNLESTKTVSIAQRQTSRFYSYLNLESTKTIVPGKVMDPEVQKPQIVIFDSCTPLIIGSNDSIVNFCPVKNGSRVDSSLE